MSENSEKKISMIEFITNNRDIVLKNQSNGNAAILNSFDQIATKLLQISEKCATLIDENQSLKTQVQSLEVQQKKVNTPELN